MALPIFDHLYAVSDLHFGGDDGFQIFNQGKCLAKTIMGIAADSKKSTGLVLNGDIVDFLAEHPAKHLDPLGAIDKLERITNDPAFNTAWQALQTFITHNHCQLILVLGNHDVELALPEVQQWLIENLAQDDAAKGRIRFCFDGTGFACQVGDKRVLCMHGNEVDDWNVVDYLALVQLGRALNRSQELPEWDANAGTRLVIGVMNQVKKRYPMVDLLKPEVKGVIPTILALNPDIDGLMVTARLATVMGQLGKDTVRRSAGFLAAEDELAEQATQASAPFAELEQIMAEMDILPDHGADYSSQLLQTAYQQAHDSNHDSGLTDLPSEEMLGLSDWWKKWFKKDSPAELLRKTLACLIADSPAFNLDHKDDTFKDLSESVGDGVDYLIAGHTHLRRALPRRNGYYYNSGTWIRLIRLTKNVLEDGEAFEKVFAAFKAGTMQALDDHEIPGPKGKQKLVLLEPSVVEIHNNNGQVYGQLSEAKPDGRLELVKGSRFPGGAS
jgi:UDP-2,3-diacylglucosamine pyrophosphatase LpxH